LRQITVLPVVVILALGCGFCFAAASVLQQSAAAIAPPEEALRPRLLIDLLHRRRWLWGLAASVGGFGLQGLALHFGGLVLVEPLVLTELLFALPLASRLNRRPVQRRQWLSAVAITGGLALFLTVAAPHGGRTDVPGRTWLLVGGAAVLAVGACALLARFRGPVLRATLLGAGAGIMFGLLAALLDTVTYLLAQKGLGGTLASWQPYLLGVVAPAGELFAQSAYQAGALTASLPVIDAVEPGVAIAIGITAFREHIAHTPTAIILEAFGLLVVVSGIVTLDLATLLAADADDAAADDERGERRTDVP
jgi:drug/metabolite transporter (DMT)-like permease